VNGDLAMRMHLAAKILAAPREFFAIAQHQHVAKNAPKAAKIHSAR
jgi:hypothetical protein